MTYASSNHAVANDNGDEGTSGGSDHGDDGPGADNADETNAEAQAAPERTMAALTEEWPTCMKGPFAEHKTSKQAKKTTQRSLIQKAPRI